ncbi:MAG TPA: aminotransferase class III-fold pyridoxal phosphate-dependent enzyme [Bacteroidia bacterium]|jgi:acetylornithine aminotransferase
MNLFDVYPLFDITPVKARGSFITDDKGNEYLDLYGGHAVISVGHSHPQYIKALALQLNKIGFYSNAVKIPLQEQLAKKLGRISGCNAYQLFLCNSGTEANENALKLASFHNNRKKVIAFKNSFHGRTSLSVGVTDDTAIAAEINRSHEVVFLPLNDSEAFTNAIDEDTCAVIMEGIQGVGGINVATDEFLRIVEYHCRKKGALLIMDEIQSGYGRTGKFFAFQHSGIKPDLITIAKGMGNGFPIAGVLIQPGIEAKHGLLGTTFGGNYLACSAAISVLEIIDRELLMVNAKDIGNYLMEELKKIKGIKKVKGKGLMIGIETEGNSTVLRTALLMEQKVITGYSPGKNTIRLLPPLSISKQEADQFLTSIKLILEKTNQLELSLQ